MEWLSVVGSVGFLIALFIWAILGIIYFAKYIKERFGKNKNKVVMVGDSIVLRQLLAKANAKGVIIHFDMSDISRIKVKFIHDNAVRFKDFSVVTFALIKDDDLIRWFKMELISFLEEIKTVEVMDKEEED